MLSQAVDVYRWRDAQGQLHYAQMLPANLPEGTPFDKVNLAITPPPLPPTPSAPERLNQTLQAQAPAAGLECTPAQRDARQYELKRAADLLELGQRQCQLRYPGGMQSLPMDFQRCLNSRRYLWQQNRTGILQRYPCA
ncbi:DUF4124 domain-containing protein [Pseudaeromonas paramecii]